MLDPISKYVSINVHEHHLKSDRTNIMDLSHGEQHVKKIFSTVAIDNGG